MYGTSTVKAAQHYSQVKILFLLLKFSRCAAKAFYSCPAIISRRPESQNTPKEPQLNPEEESRIIQARSHVTLEKSSRNYKPSEE
jgi:hypothetical protein